MPGMKKTMDEWKEGKLHSGSKHGPEVKSQKQAIAIDLSEERKAGMHVPKPHESHKKPEHPHKHSTHHEGYAPHMEHHESNHGHPGEHLRLKEDGHGFPMHESPDEPGEKLARPGAHGYPGMHMNMGPKAHGFGHSATERHGHHRMSGHPGAHRIGHRK